MSIAVVPIAKALILTGTVPYIWPWGMNTSAGVAVAMAESRVPTDAVTPPGGAALFRSTRMVRVSSSLITRSAEGSVLRLIASTRNTVAAGW